MNGIADSNLAKLYRRIAEVIQESPTLDGAIVTWREWGSEDVRPGNRPPKGRFAVELFPTVDSQVWSSPDSHELWLAVRVRLTFNAKTAADYLNAWAAVVRSVYPVERANRLVLQEEFRENFDCLTGEPQIQWPVPSPEMAKTSGTFDVQGYIRYHVRWQLNT